MNDRRLTFPAVRGVTSDNPLWRFRATRTAFCEEPCYATGAVAADVWQGVPGFGQPGAEPADRPLAGRHLDTVDRRPHRIAFLRTIHLGQPQRIGLVVADQLPAEPAGLFDNLRVMIAYLAV